MSNALKSARSRAQVNGERVVYCGRIPAVSRNYRVLADSNGHLHIERDFDFDPGVWHREATVVRTGSYREILKRHSLGGDGLTYVSP